MCPSTSTHPPQVSQKEGSHVANVAQVLGPQLVQRSYCQVVGHGMQRVKALELQVLRAQLL
eukprot:1158119-Pelagomonas_calceolata.AAC.5